MRMHAVMLRLLLAASRRVAAAVAIVLLFALPLAQVARGAVIAGEVHCCCGDHSADEACGCPDCPAAAHPHDGDDGGGGDDHDDHDGAPPTTSFGACGAEGQELSVGAFPPFILPPTTSITTALRSPRSIPPPDATPPDPLIDRSIVPS
jgi:hypothetical protein